MQNKIGRVMSAAVIAGCALGSISVPAFAEGSFKSHLSSVRVGFETRSWHDNANGAAVQVFSYSHGLGNTACW